MCGILSNQGSSLPEGGGTFTWPSSGIQGHGDAEGHGTDNKPADAVIICISLYLFFFIINSYYIIYNNILIFYDQEMPIDI